MHLLLTPLVVVYQTLLVLTSFMLYLTSLNPQNLRNIIKKVAKISIIQINIELIRLSVKTTVFCYFLQLFKYPTNFARLR